MPVTGIALLYILLIASTNFSLGRVSMKDYEWWQNSRIWGSRGSEIIWNVVPYNLVDVYPPFGGIYCLHLQTQTTNHASSEDHYSACLLLGLLFNPKDGGSVASSTKCRIWRSHSINYSEFYLSGITPYRFVKIRWRFGCNVAASYLSLAWLLLQPWRWRRYVPRKCLLSCIRLHNVLSQKIEPFCKIKWCCMPGHSAPRW
jgi:hypothetical protein